MAMKLNYDRARVDWYLLNIDRFGIDFEIKPLFVDKQVYEGYYNGFSNSVLWPLFHYFPTLVLFTASYYDDYVRVNKRFCKELLSILQPGDIIWVHDYQ